MAPFSAVRPGIGHVVQRVLPLRLRGMQEQQLMKIPSPRTMISVCVMLASVATVFATGGGAAAGAPSRQIADVDWSAVQDALGRPGTMMPGDVLRIGMPRSDLKVTVNGVSVQAGFALGS